jgi:peptidyl-prolyl cis-trans isomerase SurA
MILFVFLLTSFVLCEEELLDGVLAVVGDKHILFSEVLGEARMVADKKGVFPQSSPSLFKKVFDSVLKDKIYLKVVLLSAEKDSAISVSYEEIKNNLDNRISMFSDQLGSEKALEEAFGLSLSEIKNQYWETVKEEILIEKFRGSLLSQSSISKNEVFSFYEEFKDSIPLVSEKATFSILEKKVEPSLETLKKLNNKILSIKDSIVNNLNSFEFYAEKYSEDISVKYNKGVIEGDRGGDLPLEYEKTVFSIKEGEVVGPVETSLGLHIIKLIERLGEKTKSQHILFKKEVSPEDFSFSSSFLDSVLNITKNDPGLFDSLAVSLGSRENISGYYKEIEVSPFPENIKENLSNTELFSHSAVFGDSLSLYLLYKYGYTESSKKTLENSWGEIESMALNKKRVGFFDRWVQSKLDNVYVKINENF